MKLVTFFIICSFVLSTTNEAQFYTNGESIIIPFDGWFFNTNSTQRLVEALKIVPKLEFEVMKNQEKVGLYQEFNKEMMEEFRNLYKVKEKKMFIPESVIRGFTFGLGFVSGVGLTIGLYNLVEKAR
jgi:hypothetical protein